MPAPEVMYADELSNSVQSIDIGATVDTNSGINENTSEDSEESSIEKAIKVEGTPILPPGYHLSHCLAEGCMGRVFLVINPETKDCLAAKVVNVYGRHRPFSSNLAETNVAKVRADLRQEADLQRRLKHHNIATLYGIRNTASFTFMFMELLTGGELFERIPIGVGLHVQQMFIYYAQILDALNYLHNDQHIAHLDVKPENIMLTKKDRAKLIDFGWAVDLRKTRYIQGPVGTASYAAPEVFGKSSYAGPPADLFSLGVTLLTAVTGQRCWSRAHPTLDPVYRQWTERKDLHTGPVFSRLPPDLANFLTRALDHRPSARLTVEGIRAHPWYRLGMLRRLTPVAPPAQPKHTTDQSNHQKQHQQQADGMKNSQTYTCLTNCGARGDAPVPSSQPVFTHWTQIESNANDLCLSQPVDTASMLMASQALCSSDSNSEDDRLGFSCLMRRMTRFFSALPSLEHTMEVIRAVVVQRRQLRATARGPSNLLVAIRSPEHPGTVFRILLYPLAGSILVDCRRVSGDGLLFHQTYTAIHSDLVAMGAVNNSHPYLRIVLPERPNQENPDESAASSTVIEPSATTAASISLIPVGNPVAMDTT